MRRLDELALHSDDPANLTRLFLSPSHRAAVDTVMGWMQEAGLEPVLDGIGNISARYEAEKPDAPALIIASHIDTVRDAGRYDGTLGVLSAIGVIEELKRTGTRLPFAVEIIAFGDEEGVRFPVTLSGSRAVAGRFDQARLDHFDEDGFTLREALFSFGCDASAIAAIARKPEALVGYVEMHIEQGPVLENAGVPVGIVTAINGCSRYRVELSGFAGHAGTVPMDMRSDALVAAAEMVLAIESRGKSLAECVATVGRLDVKPNAVNVVPGRVTFTIDIRAPADCMRGRVVAEILAEIAMIAEQRSIDIVITPTHEEPAAPCDPAIVDGLAAAIERHGLPVKKLPSGAGHDAMVFSGVCPFGMLFVRCERGISHNPAESITQEDAETALAVMLDFVMNFRPAEKH